MALVLTASMVRLEWPVAEEIFNVAMNLATIQHHSFMESAVVDVRVQVGSPLRFDYDLSSAEKSDGASDETSSVIECMSPAPCRHRCTA